jgi:hypothetical protein
MARGKSNVGIVPTINYLRNSTEEETLIVFIAYINQTVIQALESFWFIFFIS